MPHKKYLVTPTGDEREYLAGLLAAGKRLGPDADPRPHPAQGQPGRRRPRLAG